MAPSWESKRLEHEQAMYERLQADMVTLSANVSRLVLLAATTSNDTGERIIPFRRHVLDQLSARVWKEVIRPHFIGSGDQPLVGIEPKSPYMTLIVDGIRGATAIQVERQVAIINDYASPTVKAWLTGRRAFGEMTHRTAIREIEGDTRVPWYDPFHAFVDPNGHTLSERGWNTAEEMRRAIDEYLHYHISIGTPAIDIAKGLEPFLWPDAAKQRTKTPYGADGSYWARRLARTEITAAAGRSLVNAALANPFVAYIKWNLSLSHPDTDICDTNAHGGENGDGTYPKDDFPQYPGHPNELCFLTMQVTKTPDEVNRILEDWINADVPEARALRGAFNQDWLLKALMNGDFVGSVLDNEFVNLAKLIQLALEGAA